MSEPIADALPAPGPPAAAPRSTSRVRVWIQLIGFLISIGLLTWCASVAFSKENREQQAKLMEAPWTDVALLILLSLTSLALNATAFWSVIRPVRALTFPRVLAVNTVATTLAYLPFKLSLVFRAAAHNRQDGVPLLTVGAWIGNVGLIMLAIVVPVFAASAWRTDLDPLWWVVAGGGALAACAALVLTARVFAHERRWGALERVILGDPSSQGSLRRALRRSGLLPRAHEGVRMLAHPAGVLGGAAARAADIGVQAARFVIAARIVGVELPPHQAVAAAGGYFLIGVLSPAGMLGFREGVFTALQSASFAVVVLTVSALEMVVNLICAGVAACALRKSRPAPRADGPP